MSQQIEGICQPEFEPVKLAFSSLFDQFPELGSSCALYHQGELVVNLWAGRSQKQTDQRWQEDTLVNVFSTGKGVAALCVQKAIDMGLIDLDRRVHYYWPQYGCEGKKETQVAAFLNHSAGQPAVKTDLVDEAIYDWDFMVSTLAKESPWWQPGTMHGYHMITFSWLVGELFRRACGMTLNQFLQQEFVQPLGLDMAYGLSDHQLTRVTNVVATAQAPASGRLSLFEKLMTDPASMTARSLTNPTSIMHGANTEAWRRAELAGANLHATAASLATLYGSIVSDQGVLSGEAVQRCQQQMSMGEDAILQTCSRFGPGFMLQQLGSLEAQFGPGEFAFGHPGSGGSLAFADPQKHLGFAYVMNQMGPYVLIDPRPVALIEAIYGCLESISNS